MRIIFALILLLISGVNAAAAAVSPDLQLCFRNASEKFQIEHHLLIAIAEVESSMNPRAIGLNKKNGKVLSEDVGLMQINSSWYPVLLKMGITREHLLSNPCQNIYVGAWILAKNISANGVNWESVGAYNAGFKNANAPFRLKYAKKVYDRFLVLRGEG